MSARGVRIVVGEGPSTRKGLLRFVLDGEGYDVVAEASTTAELARLMAAHHPDVVALDDGIGATAVGMINEMSPNTKVVLVWPGAVMPIGGAARVEPSKVLQELGPTVERLTGQPCATGTGQGPDLLETATNDPDMLRALLLGGATRADELIIEDREPAPVVILPLTPTIEHDELVLNVPEPGPQEDERTGAGAGVAAGVTGAAVLAGSLPAAAASTAEDASVAARGGVVGAQSTLNRRLGNLALGGAAVASALVLALALGGARVPIEGVRGQQAPPVLSAPPTTEPTTAPDPGTGPNDDGGGKPGGGGNDGAGGNGTGSAGTLPAVTLVGNQSPTQPGPPDVSVDTGDIGTGGNGGGGGDTGGGGSGSNSGGGGDDHNGDDAGDHDRGGGNDRDGGDHDNGGGNDGDGGDHDKGGGNDDPDNPGGGGGNGRGGGGKGGNGNGGGGGNGGGSGSGH
ncbi:MAG: hypothetical protein OEW66_07185 [Actinomycetota bacterium]|nr:hypothetical protein [Actinomycetota bacterium]